MNIPKYDIFSGKDYKDAVWLESVEGLGNASDRMREIARATPGAYFVFSKETRKILASIDTLTMNSTVDTLKHNKNTAEVPRYIHTLLFSCPDCALPVAAGRLTHEKNMETIDASTFSLKCTYCEEEFKAIGLSAKQHYVEAWTTDDRTKAVS
jgi:hypothetical protein